LLHLQPAAHSWKCNRHPVSSNTVPVSRIVCMKTTKLYSSPFYIIWYASIEQHSLYGKLVKKARAIFTQIYSLHHVIVKRWDPNGPHITNDAIQSLMNRLKVYKKTFIAVKLPSPLLYSVIAFSWSTLYIQNRLQTTLMKILLVQVCKSFFCKLFSWMQTVTKQWKSPYLQLLLQCCIYSTKQLHSLNTGDMQFFQQTNSTTNFPSNFMVLQPGDCKITRELD